MKAHVAKFRDGLVAFPRGMKLILQSRVLQLWSLMPFAIAAVVVCLTLPKALASVPVAVHFSLLKLGATSGMSFTVLYYLLNVLLWPLFAVLWFYGIFLVIKLIGSPFHALLAERVLVEQGVLRDHSSGLGEMVRRGVRLLVVALLEIIAFAAVGLILAVGSLVPGLNILTSFGFFLIVAFACADYAFDSLQMGFKQRMTFFVRNAVGFSGFAVTIGLLFLIPGLNLLLFPAAVAGATDLVRRLQLQEVSGGS
jgi:CysZ protein